ncbi:MAG: RNA-binding domain-containing protein [Candidatus Thorarchaeota archaeon]|jgi:RNA binding exosome subunit
MSNSRESTGPYIERLEARAYSRATELPERVSKSILNLFPEDTRKRVKISKSSVEGHQGIPMLIIKGILSAKKLTEQAAIFILQSLSAGSLKTIQQSLDQRIDNNCTLFLRIDKQAAYLERIEMAMNADVISLQIGVRNWPRCSSSDAKDLIQHLISLTGVLEH